MLISIKNLKKCLVLILTSTLFACGGGIYSGADLFPCDDTGGTWEGKAVSKSGNRGGIMSISLNQTDCKIVGAVAFPPCVPVTPINGSASSLFGDLDTIETVDKSLFLEDAFFSNLDDVLNKDVRAAVPIGQQQEMIYVFTNTQNRPNCPASDKGVVILTKIK